VARKEDIMLLQKAISSTILKAANVLGLGLGYKETQSLATKELALIVMVREKLPLSLLKKRDKIPPQFDKIPVDVLQVGKINAYDTRTRTRPLYSGISIGHYAVHAGTLGVVVYDGHSGKPMLLSNNHILANGNDALIGDPVLQPAPADGGKPANDRVARLERFVNLKYTNSSTWLENDEKCKIAQIVALPFNLVAAVLGSQTRLEPVKKRPVNFVDAALAQPDDDGVLTDEIRDLGKVNGIAAPEIGMKVKKSGRTTGCTTGVIKIINAEIEVGYSGGRTAYFKDQIITNDMADPGDSGSLLLTEDNRAVGLCCSGSGFVTVYNTIDNVLRYLNIKLAE